MIIIDTCQKQELQDILDLYYQLHPKEEPIITPERERAFGRIMADPNSYLLTAREDGNIIGTAHLTILNNLSRNGSPGAYVENVVVDREHRGQGIGEKLIAVATEKARENGCYKIFLCTGTIHNDERQREKERRHRFYRKTGLKDGIKNTFVRYLDKNI